MPRARTPFQLTRVWRRPLHGFGFGEGVEMLCKDGEIGGNRTSSAKKARLSQNVESRHPHSIYTEIFSVLPQGGLEPIWGINKVAGNVW
jgi:hypothetical protein